MHSCASKRNVRGVTHAGEARAQDELHLPTLVAKLGPYAQSRSVSYTHLTLPTNREV